MGSIWKHPVIYILIGYGSLLILTALIVWGTIWHVLGIFIVALVVLLVMSYNRQKKRWLEKEDPWKHPTEKDTDMRGGSFKKMSYKPHDKKTIL